ncbi:alpha/beta fold hydrolase [Saccharothrix sp. NPDC042600]|uniref:alpha/beta hydrolase n=1 Tax=Saccharothrix TaxID=2071 RepID=UPI0033CDD2F0|nr:alpha/beta hydrolase [Saccharothrix mutabilis subsp. capreolus]
MPPALDVLAPAGPVRAAVLVLHGGRAHGYGRVHRARLTYLRMLPFAKALRRDGVAVHVLRYRYQGWNAPHLHPVEDARWALSQMPDVPTALVGHSMGGRTALRVADDPQVVAVCALAPWIEPGEPMAQLAGRSLLIAHGDRERYTDPAKSYRYAVRARGVTERVARFAVHGDGHAMLRRAADWTRLVTDYVLGELNVEPVAPYIANAMCSSEGLDVPLGGTRGGNR